MNMARTLINYEMELVSPPVRANPDRMNELIAEDFEEFGSSGKVITKADVLKADGPIPAYALSDFSVRFLEARAALVKYRASTSDHSSYRSSIWVNVQNRWQLLHHQSTVVPRDD